MQWAWTGWKTLDYWYGYRIGLSLLNTSAAAVEIPHDSTFDDPALEQKFESYYSSATIFFAAMLIYTPFNLSKSRIMVCAPLDPMEGTEIQNYVNTFFFYHKH